MADPTTGWTILKQSAWLASQQQFVIYEYSAVLLVFVIIGIAFLFKDAWPFVIAKFTHNVVVGVMDKSKRLITPNRDFKKHNGMYYYKGEPQPFIKMYPGNFLFTGMSFDILDVDLNVIQDPRYKKACKDLQKAGYPNINALERAILFSQLGEGDLRLNEWITREGFKTYESARKAINPGNLTVEHAIVKQFFTAIPLSEMLGYGTEVPSTNVYNEVDDIFEARKPSMKFKRDMMKMVPFIVIIFAATCAAAVAYMLFFK